MHRNYVIKCCHRRELKSKSTACRDRRGLSLLKQNRNHALSLIRASALSLSRCVLCGVRQGVRACRMLRPKLTLHVGEHALTNICHRHRLALLVCIPRRVHVSSFERHFHSIEISHFPFGSASPLARLAACVYRNFETNLRVRDDEPDETIADWCEGCQIVWFWF